MCKLTNPKVPYFNGPIFLENKTQVGKVEEIFGPINASMFTIKMAEGAGVELLQGRQVPHLAG